MLHVYLYICRAHLVTEWFWSRNMEHVQPSFGYWWVVVLSHMKSRERVGENCESVPFRSRQASFAFSILQDSCHTVCFFFHPQFNIWIPHRMIQKLYTLLKHFITL